MKKVVVVVNKDKAEWFEGDVKVVVKDFENLTIEEVITLPNPLIIKDGTKKIAVFNHWLYWRTIES